jgi:hypothetical protein
LERQKPIFEGGPICGLNGPRPLCTGLEGARRPITTVERTLMP